MNLIYFKSDIGNFGDDLNVWLWEQLLGDFKNYQNAVDFVGIGSIFDQRIKSPNKKIIFGSGVRDFNLDVNTFNDLDIRFVRGPISGKITNGSPYITDSAYALRLLPKAEVKKRYKKSFIPYFRHVNHFNWSLFEKVTGIHVISPILPVEHVIEEIQASEQIMTAAMHGAILADIYRVPWMRVKFTAHGSENGLTSELKWNDWLLSVGLNNIPTIYFDFTLNYTASKMKQYVYLSLMKVKLKKLKFVMSTDATIKDIEQKLRLEIEKIKTDYKL